VLVRLGRWLRCCPAGRGSAAVRQEGVELRLVPRMAQAFKEGLELALLLLQPADRVGTVSVERLVATGRHAGAVRSAAERGVLHQEQLERIKNTIKGLVAELESHDDREPVPEKADDGAAAPPRDEREMPKAPPSDSADGGRAGLAPAWRTNAPVLCLAGKGPLDEAASSMLAQLLGKHGLAVRVTPYQAASREEIGRLDVTGIAMVCISYLDITGSPSHLRYLIQRLQRKLPGVPILVGLWPSEDDALKSDRVRAVIGADYYSTSLREAVNDCVEAAHKASGAADGVAASQPRSAGLVAAQAGA